MVVLEEKLEDCTAEELRETLPTHQPRFIVSFFQFPCIFVMNKLCRLTPSVIITLMEGFPSQWFFFSQRLQVDR